MTQFFARHGRQAATALGLALLVAGCAAPPPPPPLPPPPPKPIVVQVPPRPTPPNHASPDLAIPLTDAAGLRVSVNRDISPAQAVWNLRSAYNVAALNCRGAEHGEILPNYRAFLKANAAGLTKANKTVDSEFRQRYGTAFIAPRERYMTEVYNHFALPPTMPDFCNAVLAMSREALTVKSAGLAAFAARSLPSVEIVFDDFYRRYDAYRVALAEWTARYGQSAMKAEPAPVGASLSVASQGQSQQSLMGPN